MWPDSKVVYPDQFSEGKWIQPTSEHEINNRDYWNNVFNLKHKQIQWNTTESTESAINNDILDCPDEIDYILEITNQVDKIIENIIKKWLHKFHKQFSIKSFQSESIPKLKLEMRQKSQGMIHMYYYLSDIIDMDEIPSIISQLLSWYEESIYNTLMIEYQNKRWE